METQLKVINYHNIKLMKRVLYLTDLSRETIDYIPYILSLAKLMDAEIHVCYISNTLEADEISKVDVHPLFDFFNSNSTKEDVISFNEYKLEVEQFLSNEYEGMSIHFHFRNGNFINSVNKISEQLGIDLIVLKTNTRGKVHNFLYHSHAIEMIQEIQSPLLILPREFENKMVSKITFATTLRNKEMNVIQNIQKQCESKNVDFGCLFFTNSITEISKYEQFQKFNLEIIKHSSFEEGIKQYAKNNHLDILGMFHRDLSLWIRFLHNSHTKSVVYELNTPILVLHTN